MTRQSTSSTPLRTGALSVRHTSRNRCGWRTQPAGRRGGTRLVPHHDGCHSGRGQRTWRGGTSMGSPRKQGAHFPGESEFIERFQVRAARHRVDVAARATVRLVLRSVGNGRDAAKLVVFVSSTAGATQLAQQLPAVVGVNAAFLLTSRLSPDQIHLLLWEFERLDRPGVLVTDRTGEDGLNLQFADGVLHLDLPTSLMRMEQRMGRLDQIGRGRSAHPPAGGCPR